MCPVRRGAGLDTGADEDAACETGTVRGDATAERRRDGKRHERCREDSVQGRGGQGAAAPTTADRERTHDDRDRVRGEHRGGQLHAVMGGGPGGEGSVADGLPRGQSAEEERQFGSPDAGGGRQCTDCAARQDEQDRCAFRRRGAAPQPVGGDRNGRGQGADETTAHPREGRAPRFHAAKTTSPRPPA